MSKRGHAHRSAVACEAGRAASAVLLRPGQRELWHEAAADGGGGTPGEGAFLIRHGGEVEQRGGRRQSTSAGPVRSAGAVALHVLTVADAIEAAYADRCRTVEAGAWT